MPVVRRSAGARGAGARGEAEVERAMSGVRRTPGSGNKGRKGDLQGDDVTVEVKTTERDGYRVSLADLRKLEREAAASGRTPVMVVNFGAGRSYAVLPLEDYEELRSEDQDR